MTDSAFPSGLAELAPRYDAFVFDLWGVLHDGGAVFPCVLPVLRGLREQGKKIGILSNSPRPVAAAAANIARKFGLEPALYDALLTSGQLAYEALRDRPDDAMRRMGRRFVPVGAPHEIDLYLDLGLQPVTEARAADFVLCTGLLPGLETIEDYQPLLEAWRAAELPFLCANPDRVVMRGTVRGLAGGAIAEAYSAMGGAVREDFGKPYAAVFRRMARALLTAPGRMLMIGDNLQTDIAGAAAAGMKTLWVTGGVHAPELAAQDCMTTERLRDFARRQGLRFDHHLPELRW